MQPMPASKDIENWHAFEYHCTLDTDSFEQVSRYTDCCFVVIAILSPVQRYGVDIGIYTVAIPSRKNP